MTESHSASNESNDTGGEGPTRPVLLSGAQIRSFTMIGILVVVWLTFQILTSGIFLTSRNITNLSGQVAITAILACGIVMVIVPAHIDLSIGATVSFCAVVAAMASSKFGFSAPAAIAVTLLVGVVIGAWHGYWVAVLRVPAFIVTLGSLLAVRGIALVVTSSETLSPERDLLVISDSSLPAGASAILLLILWAGVVALQWREFRAQCAAAIPSSFLSIVGLPAAFTGVVAGAAGIVAAGYRGLPVPVVLLLVVMAVIGAIMRLTTFGRRLYAIGGNYRAAALAGIDITFHTFMVFVGMGLLYGLAGLVLVSRLASAPPNAGNGMELNVIAAAVIGGTSLLGGRGTVSGAIIGAVLMESLSNGMSLMNLPSAYQAIAVGFVLLVAVWADIRGRGTKALTE